MMASSTEWSQEDAEDSSSDSIALQEEIENALYSQIHFETNNISQDLTVCSTAYDADVSVSLVETEKEVVPEPNEDKKKKKKSKQFVSVTYEIDSADSKKPVTSTPKADPVQYVIDKKGSKGDTNSVTDKHGKDDNDDDSVIALSLSPDRPSPLTISDDSDHWNFSDVPSSDSDDSLIMELGIKSAKSADLQFNMKKPAGFYDLQSILDSLEDGDWSVNESDQLGYKVSEPAEMKRYYGKVNVQCHNCKQRGHLSKDCPEPKKVPKCVLCGLESHNGYCAGSACYSCLRLGHIPRMCMTPKYPCWKKTCNRCHREGHLREDCSDLWRQFHLTTVPGKPLVKGSEKERKKKSCAHCGKKGHIVEDCHSLYANPKNTKLPLFSSFIAHYDSMKEYKGYERRAAQQNGFHSYQQNKRQGVKQHNHSSDNSFTRGKKKQGKKNGMSGNTAPVHPVTPQSDAEYKGKKRWRKMKGSKQFTSSESLAEPAKKKGKKGQGNDKPKRERRHSLRLEEAATKKLTA